MTRNRPWAAGCAVPHNCGDDVLGWTGVGSVGSGHTRAEDLEPTADDDQLSLIHASKHQIIRLVAPAGSGKTQTIIHRALQQTKLGVRADRILCLTSVAIPDCAIKDLEVGATVPMTSNSVAIAVRNIRPKRCNFLNLEHVIPGRHIALTIHDGIDEARFRVLWKCPQIDGPLRIAHASAMTGRTIEREELCALLNLSR